MYQVDLGRLLAYSSVGNMGIVGLGLGLSGAYGAMYGSVYIAVYFLMPVILVGLLSMLVKSRVSD